MTISSSFLEELKKYKIIKIVEVPKNNYYYEYIAYNYLEGRVFGLIELDNEIISDINGEIIGHFGLNLEHNTLVYYYI